jgi:DNA-binding MarR family transcriptional regulator
MPKNVRRTNPEPAKNWKRPTDDDKRPLFVHSALDEYGLNLYEFRILAHVARRESKNRGCDAAQGKMAKVCGMSQRMVLEVLAVLCDAGILRKEKADGRRTNSYRLNPPSNWEHPSKLDEIRNKRHKTSIAAQEDESAAQEDES